MTIVVHAADAAGAMTSAATALVVAANVERIDEQPVVGRHDAELDRAGRRRTAVAVDDLVPGVGDRSVRAGLGPYVRQRVDRVDQLRELALVLGDRLVAVHVGLGRSAPAEVLAEEAVERAGVLRRE